MNTLEECGHGIWGAPESLKRLESADTARLLLISDTHERVAILRGILKGHGAYCDALIFAGDGMADIIECREEALAAINARAILPSIIAVVAGNCDLPAYRVTSETNPSAKAFFRVPLMQVLNVCGKKILVSHGHLQSVNFSIESLASTAQENGCHIAVYGHTHIAAAASHKSVFAVNPGSICLPRGESSASFAILEVKAGSSPPECSFHEPGEGLPPFAKKRRERWQK